MMTPKAYCLLRDRPPYRRSAFAAGLKRLGYEVQFSFSGRPSPRDLLLIWNRNHVGAGAARACDHAGVPVIVAENGYLPMHGTSKTFALALDHHNGAGRWPDPDPAVPRLDKLAVQLQRWRENGSEVLLLPQRGIGPPGVAMPRTWPNEVKSRLVSTRCMRRVRVRPHPGTDNPPPMDQDLVGAWCCVTWASSAGVKAICAGVPVFYEMPRWIGAPAAKYGLQEIEAPYLGDREPMLERLAWAQWSVEEVQTGEPLRRLIELHEEQRGRGD